MPLGILGVSLGVLADALGRLSTKAGGDREAAVKAWA